VAPVLGLAWAKGGEPVPKEAATNSGNQNSLGDVTNVLGFLLAGFGAVLSFFGLRSSEVTTVLRNDPGQASFIALFLLLGVLAAVLTVATKSASARNAPLPLTAGVIVALFGMGTLVVHYIPIGESTGTAVSFRLGRDLICAGLIICAASIIFLVLASCIPAWRRKGDENSGTAVPLQPSAKVTVDEATVLVEETIHGQPGEDAGYPRVIVEFQPSSAQRTEEPGATGGKHRYPPGSLRYWLLEPLVPLTVIFILSSVILIATSAYGGMRLETNSQLSFSSQVGATFAVNGPTATVSVDIAATKLPQNDYVFVDIYAVPTDNSLIGKDGKTLAELCTAYGLDQYRAHHRKIPANINALITPYVAHCVTDPCLYFAVQNPNSRYQEPDICNVLLSGSIVPNATGDVDKTLSVPFKISAYQDMDVRAEVCPPNSGESCASSLSRQNSRLDWVISNSQITPG
jgi:hypothetical protein